MRELAAEQGVAAYLVEDAAEIDPAWLQGVEAVGLTSGASAPEVLVTAACERLKELGAVTIRQLPGLQETVTFRLPPMAAARPAGVSAGVVVSRPAARASGSR